ncbi:MAG: hypothetical protein KIT22_11915, partial [Verrucomicrobiae bacterium]|nr:hypothetical protein [Verrucomicrobiae bacterium]
YPTAAALADDLESWLRGEPISVRPATAVERSVKWIRRRPLVAALGSLAILALAVGLAGTTWQWNIARRTAESARLDTYLSDMDLVQRLHGSQPQRAKAILQRHRPRSGERDLRDWEWRHFWQLCRGDEPERVWQGAKALSSTAISDDGRFVAVGEFNGGAKILDAETLELVYAGAGDVNTNIAPFMSSGNRMAAEVLFIPGTRLFAWSETRGSSNCVVQFWNADQRQIVRTFPQPYIVRNMAATADGRRLIVSYQSPDGRTIVWDLASEKPVSEVPRGPAFSNFTMAHVLAVSPDGQWMTYDEYPDYVRVVEVETGKDVWRFPLQDQYCLACEFSPDGKTLAVYGGFTKGTSPQLWNLETGESLGGLEPVPGWMSRLRFSRDGRLLYASGVGQTVNVWDLKTRALQRQLRVMAPYLYDFVVVPDETALFTVPEAKLARWDLRKTPATGARMTLPVAPQLTTPSWRFMKNSRELLGVTTNGTVALFGGSDWTDVQEFTQGATNATRVDLLPDGSGYVVGDRSGTLSVRRWTDHALTQVIGQMSSPVSYLAVDSKTGNGVAADSHAFVAWDFATGHPLASLPHFQAEGSADLLPGGGLWTFLNYEGVATHINLTTGEIRRQQLPYSESEGFSYSPSGEYAITSGAQTWVRVYRAKDWQLIREIREAVGAYFVCLSPDGRRIATANSGSEAIRLWDFVTGRSICSLSSDIDLAQETRFSPDGSVIVQSGSMVRAISLWWAPSWEEIARREAAEGRSGR